MIRYIILSLLMSGELYGYQIKFMFDERTASLWSLNLGQIYGALKELKRRGLVDARFDRGSSHVGRWMYSLTAKGRRALETWSKRAPRAPHAFRDEILVRIMTVKQSDVSCALEQLASQRRMYEDHLDRLRKRREAAERPAHAADVLKVLALDAALFRDQAHLRWLSHCATVLRRWGSGDKSDSKLGRAVVGRPRPSVTGA